MKFPPLPGLESARRWTRRCAASSLALLLLLAAALGCAGRQPEPELAILYNAAARYHGPDRNPIIAIPGIMGSKLFDPATNAIAWGAFEGGAANPEDPEGARTIALPIGEGNDLSQMRDDVRTAGVLEHVRVKLAGISLDIQAYAGVLATLGAGGYRDEALAMKGAIDYGDDHFTCFQFPYDWRRDNVENARRLHEFIQEKREYVRAQYKKRYGIDRDVKFDIAAHSMGGLVTRYFLMYGSQDLPPDGSLPALTWEGARYVDRVILIGTPNMGSANAFVQLLEGKKFAPILPYYSPALLGTFPSTYQLLPRTRHRAVVWNGNPAKPVDIFQPAVWEEMGWGLTNPEQQDVLEILLPDERDAAERQRRARNFLRLVLARAAAFHRALDRPAPSPPGLDLLLVAGDNNDTVRRISVSSADGSLDVIEHAAGDHTVLRASALGDERMTGEWQPRLQTPIDFDSVTFLPGDHVGLTQSITFRDNVLFWLLEEPR